MLVIYTVFFWLHSMRFHLFSIYNLIYWLISPIFSHFYNTHTASLLFPCYCLEMPVMNGLVVLLCSPPCLLTWSPKILYFNLEILVWKVVKGLVWNCPWQYNQNSELEFYLSSLCKCDFWNFADKHHVKWDIIWFFGWEWESCPL